MIDLVLQVLVYFWYFLDEGVDSFLGASGYHLDLFLDFVPVGDVQNANFIELPHHHLRFPQRTIVSDHYHAILQSQRLNLPL